MPHLPFLLLPASVLFLACGQQADSQPFQQENDQQLAALRGRVEKVTGEQYDHMAGQEGRADGQERMQQPAATGFRTVPIRITGFNLPAGQKQVPAHWKELPNGAGYTAPGVSVTSIKGASFTYVTGQMAQFYQQSGVALRAPVPPEQVVEQDIAPQMRQEGYELTGQAPVPAMEHVQQQFLDNINTSNGQMRNTARINLSEWRKGDSRVALLMTWMSFQGPTTNWSYSFTRMETSADRYESEKNAWLKGESSVRYDPAFFAAFRQGEQQKMAQWQQAEQQRTSQSWAAHDRRMQGNQAAFEAQQRAHTDMVNGVNNSIMGGYNNTMGTMDRMQNTTINGIRGEQDAYNPYTGEAGKIQSGYDQYWMNNDGQYFGTNDGMYDPNVNSDQTDQWRQVPTQP